MRSAASWLGRVCDTKPPTRNTQMTMEDSASTACAAHTVDRKAPLLTAGKATNDLESRHLREPANPSTKQHDGSQDKEPLSAGIRYRQWAPQLPAGR